MICINCKFNTASDFYTNTISRAISERNTIAGDVLTPFNPMPDFTMYSKGYNHTPPWLEIIKTIHRYLFGDGTSSSTGLLYYFLDPDEPFIEEERYFHINRLSDNPELQNQAPEFNKFNVFNAGDFQFYLNLINKMYITENMGFMWQRNIDWRQSSGIEEGEWSKVYAGGGIGTSDAFFSHYSSTYERCKQLKSEIAVPETVNNVRPDVHAFAVRLDYTDYTDNRDMGTGLAIGEVRETVFSTPEETEEYFSTEYINLPQDTATSSQYRYGSYFRTYAYTDYSNCFTFFE